VSLTLAAVTSMLFPMTRITKQQAEQQFEKFANMAHAGERILVTRDGQPWLVLQPPPRAKPALGSQGWPDYPAHWREHFPNGFTGGPTATELLAKDKEDRF